MKHATSRMLFAYWDALRGERVAPERADIRPGEMRHMLADAFILATEPATTPSFRLAGTRVCALFGRELKARPFEDLWPVEKRPEAERLVRVVVSDALGMVVGALGTNENGQEVALELILLPLRHRGRTEARVLGALSPAVVPSWAGLVPIRELATTSLRIIQPTARPLRPEPPDSGRDAAERRRRFVVLEGGLQERSSPA